MHRRRAKVAAGPHWPCNPPGPDRNGPRFHIASLGLPFGLSLPVGSGAVHPLSHMILNFRAVSLNVVSNVNRRIPAMRTTAAVALEAGKPLEIMDVNLDGPKAGEVLVEIKATGLCHTDDFTLSGADPEGLFPAILGHEGAGVVLEVGPGVTSLEPGDHVIPLYTPECRECDYCLHPKTNLCQSIRSTQGQGVMPDGTSRFSMLDGTPILHYMGCSTFANHSVLPEIALAKVRSDAPFDKICYIGCGVTTGIGAVINTAKVEIGSTAIVFAGRHRIERHSGAAAGGGGSDRGRRSQPRQGRDGDAFRDDRFRQSQGGRGRSGGASGGADRGRRGLHVRCHRQRGRDAGGARVGA